MSVSKTTIVGKLTTYETPSSVPAITSQTVRASILHDGFDDTHELTSSTTPDADTLAFFEVTLSGGAATIDLTSLTGTAGATVNLNGKKIRAIKFRAKSTSAGAFTIAKGASNGFTGLGASFSTTLPANATGGAWAMFYDAGGGTAVSGTVKTFDVTGTGTQVLQVGVIAGD